MTARLPLLCAVLLLAGCGGGDDRPDRAERTATPSVTPAPSATRAAEPGVERARAVITGWSDTLRRSDVEGAAAFFTVPLVVSQGQTARLTTRADVQRFNAGLPCGSKVTGVTRQEDYFVASFELTERPGQRCDGPGNPAQVAFKLSGARIREWRQVVQSEPTLPPGGESS